MSSFSAFWIALGVSAALGWPLLILMRRLKAHAAISQYTPEHAGKTGTPSMGGIAPLIGVLAVTAINFSSDRSSQTWAMIVALVGFGLLGFVDDFLIPRMIPGKRGFGWTQKLVLQVLIASAVGWLMNPGSLGSAGITAFLVIFFANGVNFSDGLDGLCGSLLIVSCIAIKGQFGVEAFALIGALIPFLLLNAPPAKIFMGDVGALPFGALVGIMVSGYLQAAEATTITHFIIPAIATLIFILELVLVPMQLFWVKVFKKRLIPASPFHHSFEKIGWPETRITATFVLAQIILTMLALTLESAL